MQTDVLLLACRILAVVLVACGGNPGQGDFDPSGTWPTTLTWGTGTCISSGSEVTTLVIAAGAAGYDVHAGSGGSGSNVGGTVRLGCCVTLQSAFTCKGASCAWSGMTSHDDAGDTITATYQLSLDASGLTGNGTYTSSGSCGTQPFTVTGSQQ